MSAPASAATGHKDATQPDICLVSQSTVKCRVGDSLGFAMGFYCYVWLRHLTHHTLHTHSRCSSYIYLVFSTCYTVAQPQPDIFLVHSTEMLAGDSLDFSLGSCCWLLLVHPTHFISISTLYLYKVFQHLLLWLLVIRMSPQADIYLSPHSAGAVGESLGFSLVWAAEIDTPIQFILIAGLLYTHIKCFSTFNSGYQS